VITSPFTNVVKLGRLVSGRVRVVMAYRMPTLTTHVEPQLRNAANANREYHDRAAQRRRQ
jgi:hypothetical protein